MLKQYGVTPAELEEQDYGKIMSILKLEELISQKQNKDYVKEKFHNEVTQR